MLIKLVLTTVFFKPTNIINCFMLCAGDDADDNDVAKTDTMAITTPRVFLWKTGEIKIEKGHQKLVPRSETLYKLQSFLLNSVKMILFLLRIASLSLIFYCRVISTCSKLVCVENLNVYTCIDINIV